MSKTIIILLILITTIITAIGDSFLKKSGQQPVNIFNRFFLYGSSIYVLTSFIWAFTYKYMKFSTSVTIYSIFSILIFTLIGIFVFKDSISAIEILGIILAIISLIILVRFG